MVMLHNRYQVLEIVGKGENGIVYKVFDKECNRVLAIKEMVRDGFNEREAEILKECYHPGLPVLIETFSQDEKLYVAMEYVEGMTLLKYIQQHVKIKEEQVVLLGVQIGEVLCYLHEHVPAIIYGDLKPENVMITQDGKIKLIDLGAAFFAEEERTANKGTYAYAPKEQREGKNIDERSDIYAFGAILHQMLTGVDPKEPPFIRRNLRECDRGLSHFLEKLVRKCLDEKSNNRYPSMRIVVEELKNYKKKDIGYRFYKGFIRGVYGILLIAFLLELYLAYLPGLMPTLLLGGGTLAYKKFIIEKIWRKKRSYRVEKNIWKTDKLGKGLFLVIFVLLISSSFYVRAEKNQTLSVQLYDEKGRKICVKEGEVYHPKKGVRMEIGEELFLRGREVEICILLRDINTGERKEYILPVVKK